MSLEDFFVQDDKDAIRSLIKRRRLQMLIHSAIYYDMDDCIIDDHTWQKWADELTVLQREHPDCCKIDKTWDHYFKDWDGSTGNHLPHRHPWVHAKATYLLNMAIEERRRRDLPSEE